MTLDVNMLLFTLAGNSLMEVDSFLVLLAIVRWNQILLFILFIVFYLLLQSISFRQSTTSIGATHRMGVGECHTIYWFLIYSCTICKLFSLTVVTK